MLLRMWNNWNDHLVSRSEKNDVATLEHSLALYIFYLIKSNMHLPSDPTFPIPGIYPREMKTYIHIFPQNVHRALFIIIPNRKQSKYLSTGE